MVIERCCICNKEINLDIEKIQYKVIFNNALNICCSKECALSFIRLQRNPTNQLNNQLRNCYCRSCKKYFKAKNNKRRVCDDCVKKHRENTIKANKEKKLYSSPLLRKERLEAIKKLKKIIDKDKS